MLLNYPATHRVASAAKNELPQVPVVRRLRNPLLTSSGGRTPAHGTSERSLVPNAHHAHVENPCLTLLSREWLRSIAVCQGPVC